MAASITIFDIASAAGVSLATADRALNRRKGVSPVTARRVREAAQTLGWTPNIVAQSLSRRSAVDVHIVLPHSANPFVRALTALVDEVGDAFRPYRLVPHLVRVPERDPAALAAAIDGLAVVSAGIAILGLDDPRVRAAIDAAAAGGTPVVTLVSDVPGSARCAYVGIGNVAAGRTAATLMGRFVGAGGGRVALFAGDRLYADLVDREAGFRATIAARFKHIALQPSLWHVEDDDDAAREAELLLMRHVDLVGIYVAGGGLPGIARAVDTAGRSGLVLIGHDIVGEVPDLLRAGAVDAVVSQDPRVQLLRAVQLLGEQAMRASPPGRIELTPIAIHLADNLPDCN